MSAAVIGLCGFAGAGKSTVASALVATGEFVEVAIALPLKELCVDLVQLFWPSVDVSMECMLDGVLKETPFEPAVQFGTVSANTTPRQVLQVIGTDVIRKHLGDDTWIRLALQKIKEALGAGKRVVVSDVRFPDEVRALREALGPAFMLVQVQRPQGCTSVPVHASEAHANTLCHDIVLLNDGPIGALHKAAGVVAGVSVDVKADVAH